MAVERDRERHDAAHHRAPTLVESAAVGKGATELLFERQEEPGSEEERREPEAADRLEAVLAQGFHADLEERVAGDAGDQQADSDGQRAFGERKALRRRQLVVCVWPRFARLAVPYAG